MDRYYDIAYDLRQRRRARKPRDWRQAFANLLTQRLQSLPANQPPRALLKAMRSARPMHTRLQSLYPRTVHCIGSLGAGGAERQLVNLLIALEERGHAGQSLLTTNPLAKEAAHYLHLLEGRRIPARATSQVISEQGVELIRCNPDTIDLLFMLPEQFGAWSIDLWVEIGLEAPDVAHLWLDHLNIWGGPAALLANVPAVILSTRNVNPSNFPYLHAPYMQPWYSWLAQCPRVHFINNSRPGAESYAHWLGMDESRFSVILNGVNLAHLTPASPQERKAIRTELDIPAGARCVVGAFRMSDEKRPLLFVETFAHAMAACPDLHAVLMGEGPLLARVVERAGALGVNERLRVLGRRADLPKIVSAMDVLLHTAFWEGTPNILLEAQQLCVPVVATRAGGAVDAVLHGTTGVLVDREDTAGLGAALIDVLSNLSHWRAAAQGGPAFVARRFAMSRMVDETLAVHYRALGMATPARAQDPPGPSFAEEICDARLV